MAPTPARDLTQGPIAKTLFLFALPILAGNVLQSLNGSVNAIWVGRFLGEQALTATANANNVMFFLIGAIFGFGMAATILVGQAMGARDTLQAKRVIGTSASFFFAVSVVVAVLGYGFAHRVLAWMSTPPESIALAESYLRIVFVAMPLLYMFAFLSAVLRGAGDTRTPFAFLMLSVVLDIALNPLLIFGAGPLPAMGIAGSSMATLVANAIALSAMLAWLRHRRHPLWIGRGERAVFRPDPAILRALTVKGIPMGLQMVVISLAMITMISMVNAHGVATTSAYGAAMQLWTYVQMPAMAIGAACSSMAAQNVGAARWDRVGATARAGVVFNFLMTGALILPLVVFDRSTLSLFLPEGSASLEIARHMNHIVVGSFLFFGVGFVLSGVVRATGSVIPPLLMLAFAMWGIRVPFAHFMQPLLGIDAIWWSFPASASCSMLMAMAYYQWGNWRQARMLGRREEHQALPAEIPAPPPAQLAVPCPKAAAAT